MPDELEHLIELLDHELARDDLRNASDTELGRLSVLLAHWHDLTTSELMIRAEARKAQGALDLGKPSTLEASE